MRVLVAVFALPLALLPQSAVPRAERERFGHVLVVDAAGGGAYTDIQAAIGAAVAGDTVLVRSGQYAGFSLTGKGIAIVGEVGSTVVCQTTSTVTGVPLGQRVLLQNLELRMLPNSVFAGTGLGVTNNVGAVRIEECSLAAGIYSRQPGLNVSNSPDVIVRACDLHGGGTYGASYPVEYAGPGGTAIGSQVAAYQSTFLGGEGGSGVGIIGGFGGAGWTQHAGELRVEQGVFQGGDGGDNTDCLHGTGGDGGPGLRIDPPWGTPVVRSVGSTFTGGAYGLHTCGYSGNDGPPVSSGSGSLVISPGPARTLAAPALVRDATTLTFTASGQVGESVFLLISAHDGRETSPDYAGVLFAKPRYLLRVAIGTVPASGTLTYAWPVPDELVPDNLCLTLTAQAVLASPSSVVTLSNPVTIVVLDHAW